MALFYDRFIPSKPFCAHVFFGSLFVLSLLCATPEASHALQVSLGWNANQETDLAGYKLYYGGQSRTYTTSIDVGNVITYTLAGLTDGSQYYFALTAYNRTGGESDYSQEVSYPTQAAAASGGSTSGGSAAAGGATSTSGGAGDVSASTGATASTGGGGGGGGCFIATAIYGPASPEVSTLRTFRDNHLLTNRAGREFVTLYYRFSPPIARVLDRSPVLRGLGRMGLTPIVYAVSHGYAALFLVCALGVFICARKRRKGGRS